MQAKEEIPPVDQLEIFAIKLYQEKGIIILSSSVVIKTIFNLYENLVKKNEVPAIESLEVEEKNKHWEIAKRFYTDKKDAINASKVSYILHLITS